MQITFLFTIYPSLILTYAGQTAYLIKNLNDFGDGFYKFVPGPVYWPMFVIATLAAIVASQSLISASFSVIKQAVVLDYFPRVKVVHTSQSNEGQVYSPEINYILMFLCVAVVLGFGDGKDIGNAFGTSFINILFLRCKSNRTYLLGLIFYMPFKTTLNSYFSSLFNILYLPVISFLSFIFFLRINKIKLSLVEMHKLTIYVYKLTKLTLLIAVAAKCISLLKYIIAAIK